MKYIQAFTLGFLFLCPLNANAVELVVHAMGVDDANMEVRANGQRLGQTITVENSTNFQDYTFNAPSDTRTVEVHFTNDNGPRTLILNGITFQNKRITNNSNDVAYYVRGQKRSFSSRMAWSGHVEFSNLSVQTSSGNTDSDDNSSSNESSGNNSSNNNNTGGNNSAKILKITARGARNPSFRVLVNGSTIKDIEVRNTSYTVFEVNVGSARLQDIELEYYNDYGSRDLYISAVELDGNEITHADDAMRYIRDSDNENIAHYARRPDMYWNGKIVFSNASSNSGNSTDNSNNNGGSNNNSGSNNSGGNNGGDSNNEGDGSNQPAPNPGGTPTSSSECDVIFNSGSMSSLWQQVNSGSTVCFNPGTYTGGNISIQSNVTVRKTPGTNGTVVFDGRNSANTLFYIRSSNITIAGTTSANWEPDLIIKNYTNAGLRFYSNASQVNVRHVNFLDNGGFGVRINGSNHLFEYNKFEDNGADAFQAETSGGTNINNLTVRYNYGFNRMGSGTNYAWNANKHTDFIQIHAGPARNINVHGNLMVGFTNALLFGDSWGTADNVTVKDNFMLFEANGVSSNSKGNLNSKHIIEHNTIGSYMKDQADGGGMNAIYYKDPGGATGEIDLHCNVFFGITEAIGVGIDSRVNVDSSENITTGRISSFGRIESSNENLNYRMNNGRDLTNLAVQNTNCRGGQLGARFTNVSTHLKYIGY